MQKNTLAIFAHQTMTWRLPCSKIFFWWHTFYLLSVSILIQTSEFRMISFEMIKNLGFGCTCICYLDFRFGFGFGFEFILCTWVLTRDILIILWLGPLLQKKQTASDSKAWMMSTGGNCTLCTPHLYPLFSAAPIGLLSLITFFWA